MAVALVLGVGGPGVIGEAAAQKTTATLRLDWVPGAHHVGPILALKRGYYADEGIDLSIQPGKGSGLTVQAVASGNDAFGFADAGLMAVALSKGAPLVMVANITATGPTGIITLGPKIGALRDLEGKKIGVAAGDASFALFPAALKKQGVAGLNLQQVTIEPAAKVPALLEKRVDAISGFRFGDYLRVYTQNKDAKITLFSEWGVNALGNGYLVSTTTATQKPDLVRKFVRATLRGWHDAVKDEAAGVAAVLAAFPDTNREFVRLGLPLVIEHMHSPATRGKPLGWMAEEDWKATLAVMKDRGLEGDRPPGAFYTNEFLPAR
jgi:NitT/TauT family transport system substrate-binding protein